MARIVNTDINERIGEIRDKIFKGNTMAMAKRTFVSRGTLLSIIDGKDGKLSTPGYDVIRRIVEMSTPQINMEWLLTGEGEMLDAEESQPEKSYTDGVPYYDEVFDCGFNELISPSSENPEYLIRMPGYENATLWCKASGHSMEPEINNGDVIALRRVEDPSFLTFGDIYGIITTNDLRTIKRLGKSDTPGCYRLIPTNKEYDEQDIPLEKILMVYRVMGAMKAF